MKLSVLMNVNEFWCILRFSFKALTIQFVVREYCYIRGRLYSQKELGAFQSNKVSLVVTPSPASLQNLSLPLSAVEQSDK